MKEKTGCLDGGSVSTCECWIWNPKKNWKLKLEIMQHLDAGCSQSCTKSFFYLFKWNSFLWFIAMYSGECYPCHCHNVTSWTMELVLIQTGQTCYHGAGQETKEFSRVFRACRVRCAGSHSVSLSPYDHLLNHFECFIQEKTCIVDDSLHHRDSLSVSIGEQCMHRHQFTPSQAGSGSLSSSTGWACVSAAAALVGSSSLYSSLYMQPRASVFTKKNKNKLSKSLCVNLKFAFCSGHT